MDENIILNEASNKATTALLANEKITDLTIRGYTDSDIQEMIYEIRGQQVMLDSDLATLYGYEVKRLNETLIDFQRILCFL